MKIREKEITDKEVLDMLNCSACLSVVKAIKIKQCETINCPLYQAYDLVANKYEISFGIEVEFTKFYPYVNINNKIWLLDAQNTMLEAQKEILHQTMYELAHRIENGTKNIYE